MNLVMISHLSRKEIEDSYTDFNLDQMKAALERLFILHDEQESMVDISPIWDEEDLED